MVVLISLVIPVGEDILARIGKSSEKEGEMRSIDLIAESPHGCEMPSDTHHGDEKRRKKAEENNLS
jgi:hypothetical protein